MLLPPILALIFIFHHVAGGSCDSGCQSATLARSTFNIGNEADFQFIWLNISSPTNSNHRGNFYTQVDQFALLDLPGTGKTFENDGNMTLQVCTTFATDSTLCTDPVHYSDGKDSFVGFWTAVIHMKEGKPEKISFDLSLGCDECGEGTSGQCIDDSCAIKIGDGASWGSSIADIKVYTVWVGSSANDQVMTSAGLAFSRFRRYSIGGPSSTVAAKAAENVPKK